MKQIEEFFAILEGGSITTAYQPIVCLRTGHVFAYEALSRITLPSCSFNVEELFTIASQQKKLWELEKLCRSSALKHAFQKPSYSKLFINVDANVMHDPELISGFTSQKLDEYGIDPQDIVIEVTEKNTVAAQETFTTTIQHYRAQQYKIAVDDYGSGYSGLNRVCAFSPDYLKLDMELIRGIDQDSIKKSAVSATIGFCKESGIKVIAEGIETEGELKTLIQLGADYGQGYYLSRPVEGFQKLSCTLKKQIISFHQRTHPKYIPSVFGRVESIIQPKVTVQQSEPSLGIYEMMRNDPSITEVFILDEENYVCGILTRSFVLEKYGGQFGYNLSKKLTVDKLMRKDFLATETYMSIEEVANIAMQREVLHIYDAIAVTEQGKYVGTVSVKDLLMTAVQMQVKRATDANPLTGLPGNAVIQEMIESTYLSKDFWAIIYLDLDNFKAYNDAYGFTNGDLMIKELSNAMQARCDRTDFLGHIGGDDFVIVSSSLNVEILCKSICQTFRQSIRKLYSIEDWNRGFIVSKNRDGFTQNFPIATLSVAVVTNRSVQPKTMEGLSKIIAETKKLCKQMKGDSIITV